MKPKPQAITSDEEALIRACLDGGRDQAPWGALADCLDEAGRPDAATMVRSFAPGFAALSEHLPKVWGTLVRELTRRKQWTWDAVCREAGEALACAARAAGARTPGLSQMAGALTRADARDFDAAVNGLLTG